MFYIVEALAKQIIIVVSRFQFSRTNSLWPVSQKAVKLLTAPIHCFRQTKIYLLFMRNAVINSNWMPTYLRYLRPMGPKARGLA
jgi:hypothetical protein